ncbi:phage major capsid protein [Pseudarthrobacter sp. NPDC080039]|uniref:phage major capsid protein n=1 Tax=unclassified Pseudarthrobacter TaxID=2647000 RepID=UPI00344B75A0
MYTIDQLIARELEQRASKLSKRNAHTARLAELRGMDAPNEAEISRVRGAQNALDAEIDVLDERIAELRAEKAEDERNLALASRSIPTAAGLLARGAGLGDGDYRAGDSAPVNRADSASKSRFVLRDRPDVPASVDRGQRFADHPIAREFAAARAANDATVKGVYGGSLAQMVRTVTDSGTSAIVPTDWSNDLIDLARNYSAVMKAGATLVPMSANVVNIGRITGDPTSAFRAEGSAITASDPSLDNVQLQAKTMSCMVVTTMEFLQDSINGEEMIVNEIAKSMALRLDYLALYGGIVTTNSWAGINEPVVPGPRGIAATLLALRPANVLGTGNANGTPPTRYNELIDLVGACADLNESPNSLLYPSRLWRAYAKMTDAQNRPLNVPPALENLPFVITNQVKSGYALGTATTAADAFTGDFSQLLVGQRLDFTLQRADQRYIDAGQVAFICHWRGDFGIARSSAFAVYKGLIGV